MADLSRGPQRRANRGQGAPERPARPTVREPGASLPEPAASPAPSQLFLIRLWPSAAAGDTPAWEGRIQHVLSGEAASFTDLELLAAALRPILAALPSADGDPGPTGMRI